ncbi:MAG: hypothetical protein Q8P18_17185 [Pseudomonadota bacterium]|nr:hypothetical protein [Pseudomonadota bacterium]
MSLWHPCSSCKKPISHGQIYQVCSVSTCNRARSALVFCSVACWDSHVPVLNHRDAWCEERRAPREGEPVAVAARVEAAPEGRRRLVSTPIPEPVAAEVLIVASRLKQYIADRDDMNTSADVLDVLSDIVRAHTDAAMDRARADGRKTVKGRDFR